jgi:hypothetical protein
LQRVRLPDVLPQRCAHRMGAARLRGSAHTGASECRAQHSGRRLAAHAHSQAAATQGHSKTRRLVTRV